MTLIDGDRIVTAQLYDDEHEEFTEKKMSIIDYVNAYTDEGVTEAEVVDTPKVIRFKKLRDDMPLIQFLIKDLAGIKAELVEIKKLLEEKA